MEFWCFFRMVGGADSDCLGTSLLSLDGWSWRILKKSKLIFNTEGD